MATIFDLKTTVSELNSINSGLSKREYEQHPPTRDIVGNSFSNGAIHIRFQTSGSKWWIPDMSYLRLRCSLSKGTTADAAGLPLDLADDIAPAMGLASNLFQSMEFRINHKVISRIGDYVPQIDALETRLSKSEAWLKSIGATVNWWDSDFKTRQHHVCVDGTTDQTGEIIAGKVALGLDAANTVAYDASTGVWTFAAGAGAAVPDLRTILNVGDYIEFSIVGNNEQGVVLNPMRIIGVGAGALETEAKGESVAAAAGANDIVVIRGVQPRRATNFEIIWQPPLSIWKVGHAMPSGKYELVLNPQTADALQRRAIESVGANKTPSTNAAAGDHRFRVSDMFLYVATVDGPRADDITYLLDLETTRCQTDDISNASFQQKNFDVSPATYALTVAYQDLRAGTDTRAVASKFKSYDADVSADQERKLNRMFINYAGQNLPAPDADPQFVAGTDYTVQRYVETQIHSGAYFDTGGAEDIRKFHDRGSYYYFKWNRDGTDRSTRVNVHQQFNAQPAEVANMRVLLFDHSRQVARVRVQDSRVVDVQLEDQ